MPKLRIASLYLSIAHFGYGMQGIVQACRQLGKDIENLSLEVVAELIAMLKYPRPKHPTDNWQVKMTRRANHLLNLYRSPL
jgi:penicillin-binding protein 1A